MASAKRGFRDCQAAAATAARMPGKALQRPQERRTAAGRHSGTAAGAGAQTAGKRPGGETSAKRGYEYDDAPTGYPNLHHSKPRSRPFLGRASEGICNGLLQLRVGNGKP